MLKYPITEARRHSFYLL